MRWLRRRTSALQARFAVVVTGVGTAAVTAAARPVPGVVVLAVAGALASLATAFAPRSVSATVAIGSLVAGYAVASSHVGGLERAALATALAVPVAALHVVASLAAEVPMTAVVAPATWSRWSRRLGATLVPGAPLVLLVASVGAYAPRWRWLPAIGIAAAVALVGAPLAVLRGQRRVGP